MTAKPSPLTPPAGTPWRFDPADLAALYAAGALEPLEQAEFEARLAVADPDLTRELALVIPAIDALAAAAPAVAPPAHLRAQILAAAAASATVNSDADEQAFVAEFFTPDDHPRTHDPADRAASTAAPQRGRVSAALSQVFVRRLADGPWRPTGLPGVWAKPLFKDRAADRCTLLVRCDPGAFIPHHDHQGIEELIVLQGDLKVGDHLLQAGDYIRTLPGQEHGDAVSPSGCLCLFFTSVGVMPMRSQVRMFFAALGHRIARLLGLRPA